MTTICIDRDGVIAYDGRETQGNRILRDNVDKKHNYCGRVFVIGGDVGQMPAFMDACIDGGSDKNFECSGLMIENGQVFEVFSDAVPIEWSGEPMAFGSGCDHAFTAMDCGLSAKEAVKMAAKRDACTGGKIRAFKAG